MRLLHCADIHLDSKFISYLPEEKAAERRRELLLAFRRLIESGAKNNVDAIIIAGDLFDSDRCSETTRDIVLSEIRKHANISFFYVKGNHDRGFEGKTLPDNLCLFGNDWTRYGFNTEGKRLVIAGRELGDTSSDAIIDGLRLKPEDINIVVLHGQIREYADAKAGEIIPLSLFRNKNIDYMALGHIHEYSGDKLDTRGRYAYSGCLEGRGFDECGPKGAVLLDIDTRTGHISSQFIELSIRQHYECRVDVSGIKSMMDLELAISGALKEAQARDTDLIKLSLVGELDASFAVEKEYLERVYRDRFYYFRIKDMTSLAMPEPILGKTSLSGEFLRLLEAREDLEPEQKARTAKLGMALLRGENIL